MRAEVKPPFRAVCLCTYSSIQLLLACWGLKLESLWGTRHQGFTGTLGQFACPFTTPPKFKGGLAMMASIRPTHLTTNHHTMLLTRQVAHYHEVKNIYFQDYYILPQNPDPFRSETGPYDLGSSCLGPPSEGPRKRRRTALACLTVS